MMGKLKLLTASCAFLLCAIVTVNAQKGAYYQTVFWYFTPADIPCLNEDIYGTVYEKVFLTKHTVHSEPIDGVLKGATSGLDYSVEYRWNQWKTDEVVSDWHAVAPWQIRCNGKLVAEILWEFKFVYDENDILVTERILHKVNCK